MRLLQKSSLWNSCCIYWDNNFIMDLNKDMSRIPDFYDLDVDERISILLKKLGFEDDMDLSLIHI